MEGAIIKTSNDFSRPDIIRNRLLVPLPKLLLYDKPLAQPEPIFAWSIYHMAICQDSECSCKPNPYSPTVKPIQPLRTSTRAPCRSGHWTRTDRIQSHLQADSRGPPPLSSEVRRKRRRAPGSLSAFRAMEGSQAEACIRRRNKLYISC